MRKILKDNRAFTSQDAILAIIFMLMFVGVITVAFTNAFKVAVEIKADAIATNYMINCVEIAKMSEELTDERIIEIINSLYLKDEYTFSYEINDPVYGQAEDLYKNLKLVLEYNVNKQTKRMETTIQVSNKNKFLDYYEKINGSYQVN